MITMRHLHLDKHGIRGISIAESYSASAATSTLAGIIMRNDLLLDGFVFDAIKVTGDDSTDTILKMCRSRCDVSYVITWGSILSRYNIVDVCSISESLNIPVLAISDTHHKDISNTLPPEKLHIYTALPDRHTVHLHTGHTLDVHISGCTIHETRRLLNRITIQGRIPESIRLARILASAIRQYAKV